ncbi:MAG: M23 family metallopeptidase [Proteobacteria bacterium]|nr:M23 family metallopeptidase [Pseudomonadota bacterium]
MGLKRITIVFLPDGTKSVKHLKVPRILFTFLILVFLSGALALGWIIKDYIAVKSEIPRLSSLEKENGFQKTQLVVLAQKIDQIGRKVVELKEFDKRLRIMVNLDQTEDNSQFLGVGGSDPKLLDPDATLDQNRRKLVPLMHKSLDNLGTEISLQKSEMADLLRFFEDQKSMLARTPSIWPTRGWISSGFGYRISPFTNEKEFHKGLDICNRMNAPIVAPADGVVSSSGWDYGYGKTIHIEHGYGVTTRYAHLDKILVKKGKVVKRGQVVAQVGNSGRTTGPHLHYEVHLNGVPVDPLRYILN